MLVRARDKIFRMKDLKGKKIGISKSLNTIKNDWWRIQEDMGIENMLMLHDMTRDDIELVEFPYPMTGTTNPRCYSADEQPLGTVEARPQARLRLPPAGEGAAGRQSMRSTRRARSSSIFKKRRARSR